MPRRLPAIALIMLGILFPIAVSSQGGAFPIPNLPIRTFSTLTQLVDVILPQHDIQAACGGWDLDDTVGGVFDPVNNPAGKIARVDGLPGRRTRLRMTDREVLAGGIAPREEALTFPATARGFVTKCTRNQLAAKGFRLDGPPCSTPGECQALCDTMTTDEEWNPNGTPFCSGDDRFPNCKPCAGERCRCPGPGCEGYASFFRRYEGEYARSPLLHAPNDTGTAVIQAACYGFYDEADLRATRMLPSDPKCSVHVVDLNPAVRVQQQNAVGDLWPVPGNDVPPIVRNPSFTIDRDLWYQNLGGGFSLLNPAVLQDRYEDNLSLAILARDDAILPAGLPMGNARVTPPVRLRAFTDASDPAGGGDIAREWWERFESAADAFFDPPTVRVILPERIGGDVRPLLERLRATASIREDPLHQSIDITLGARDDLLSWVTAVLDRILLRRLQEVKIPVVVPGLTPLDMQAIIEGWEKYRRERFLLYGETNTGAYDAFIAKLQEQRTQLLLLQQMRADLPAALAAIIAAQRDAHAAVDRWMQDTTAAYQAYVASRQARLALLPEWRSVQQAMTDIYDRENWPWCHNDRFTAAVDQLTEWLPMGPATSVGGRTARILDERLLRDCREDGLGQSVADPALLPMLCPPGGEEDFLIDFSDVARAATPMLVPVLDVTTIDPAIPIAPDSSVKIDPVKLTVPTLSPVPGTFPELTQIARPIGIGNLPDLRAKLARLPSVDLPSARAALLQARLLLEKQVESKRMFWDSFLTGTPDLRCDAWNAGNCRVPETTMAEATQRFGARPAVNLPEDFAALAPTPTGRMFRPERRFPREGLRIGIPEGELERQRAILRSLRARLRRQALQDADNELYDTDDPETEDAILDAFNVHDDEVDLSPAPVPIIPPSP